MYSGFLQLDKDRSLFYWYVLNDKEPETKPEFLWLAGGPGMSSIFALFYENGPLEVVTQPDQKIKLTVKQRSWLEIGNLLYIDQPVGTGFSFTTNPEGYPTNEEKVADDLAVALQIFLKKNIIPAKDRPQKRWYFVGESYGGRFAPAIAHRVLKNNEGKKEEEWEKLPLSGLMIANGLVLAAVQRTFIPVASRYFSYIHPEDVLNTEAMSMRCQEEYFSGGVQATHMCNKVRDYCGTINGGIPLVDARAYGVDTSLLEKYLSTGQGAREELKAALHLEGSKREPLFSMFDSQVASKLTADLVNSSLPFLNHILTKIPVLVYNGNMDMLDGPTGVDAWMANLAEPYGSEITKAERNLWLTTVNGKQATGGHVKQWRNLNYVVVSLGAHSVPVDQLEKSINMVKTFVAGSPWVTEEAARLTPKRCKYLNDCNGNGVCQAGGTCLCKKGFGLADCSLQEIPLFQSFEDRPIPPRRWITYVFPLAKDTRISISNKSPKDKLQAFFSLEQFGNEKDYMMSSRLAPLSSDSWSFFKDEFPTAEYLRLTVNNPSYSATVLYDVEVMDFSIGKGRTKLSTVALIIVGCVLLILNGICLYRSWRRLERTRKMSEFSEESFSST